ncbi:Fanconi anemia group D2 protein-like [Gigantopelta aegis]|uniref:Fanconi anemia group D2 protein-like n=1 Tax=Gigantopelta aegis TaxID=1735272 RepID=UPI001B88B604|nr:Fanconi anemia group D2 protein-like [Gigantopelta aegis]
MDILRQANQLTVPILDALSNLALKPDLLTEVRGSVMQTLDSVKMKDLPVVVKFLLQKATAQDAQEVIDSLKSPADHKVIDIFVLLILHSTNRRKPVESLFRNKIRTSAFTEVLLHDAFGSHGQC